MARPRIELNKKDFEGLLAIGCSLPEIVAFFENKMGTSVSEDTVQRWCKREYNENFAVVADKKRELMKITLRRNQLRLSEKSASMAIFLGKNYLGQKDSIEQVVSKDSAEALKMLTDAISGINEDQ